MDHFKNFYPFGQEQILYEDEIVYLIEFSPPLEWQKQLHMHEIYSDSKRLNDLVRFWKRLNTVK